MPWVPEVHTGYFVYDYYYNLLSPITLSRGPHPPRKLLQHWLKDDQRLATHLIIFLSIAIPSFSISVISATYSLLLPLDAPITHRLYSTARHLLSSPGFAWSSTRTSILAESVPGLIVYCFWRQPAQPLHHAPSWPSFCLLKILVSLIEVDSQVGIVFPVFAVVTFQFELHCCFFKHGNCLVLTLD
ncbi:hypothetical protein BGX38DRAFT_177961 [Terfezia claveryi]|nr:hypothetical protein BGX38DRAFT_177961 [Terfezia claveryi]